MFSRREFDEWFGFNLECYRKTSNVVEEFLNHPITNNEQVSELSYDINKMIESKESIFETLKHLYDKTFLVYNFEEKYYPRENIVVKFDSLDHLKEILSDDNLDSFFIRTIYFVKSDKFGEFVRVELSYTGSCEYFNKQGRGFYYNDTREKMLDVSFSLGDTYEGSEKVTKRFKIRDDKKFLNFDDVAIYTCDKIKHETHPFESMKQKIKELKGSDEYTAKGVLNVLDRFISNLYKEQFRLDVEGIKTLILSEIEKDKQRKEATMVVTFTKSFFDDPIKMEQFENSVKGFVEWID